MSSLRYGSSNAGPASSACLQKESVVIIVFIYLFFNKIRFSEERKKFPLYGFIFIGIVCAFFFVGDAPFQAKIASARMFSLPLLLSFLGFWGIDSPEELHKYLEHVFRCSVLSCGFWSLRILLAAPKFLGGLSSALHFYAESQVWCR